MSTQTEIAWTDATWNPIRGCSMARGSETGGCLNCYAARMVARNLKNLKSPTTGKPFARILQSGPRWTGDVELIESALSLPMRWRRPRRVFVNSMSDLFHENLSDEQIDRVFAVMARSPQHTFQVLTKRPERMWRYLNATYSYRRIKVFESATDLLRKRQEVDRRISWECEWPLPNVWLGVSVENQATADARIPLLIQTPAAKRFVSYEPALEAVDFKRFITCDICRGRGVHDCQNCAWIPVGEPGPCGFTPKIDWVIVGGESGPGARRFDVQCARDVIRQCKDAGVACFVKQMGAFVIDRNDAGFEGDTSHSWPIDTAWTGLDLGYQGAPVRVLLKDRKGSDPQEWPEDLRVREFPC